MRRILDHETRSRTVRRDDGSEASVEAISSVTFTDHAGAVHTLVFHPPGTDVAGEHESRPRIVGQDVPDFAFDSPQAAVDAYERGEIV